MNTSPCGTGFHDRCFDDLCGCLCGHRALRESVPAPKPASEHVALQYDNEQARDGLKVVRLEDD